MSRVNLSDVQGHILKGFNKPTVRLIFFRFRNEKNEVKKWLMDISKKIPSTTELINASKKLRDRRIDDPSYEPQEIWLHLSLSRTGLNKLELPFPPSRGFYTGTGKGSKIRKREEYEEKNDPFKQGMKHRESLLIDNIEVGLDNWIEPFRTAKPYSHLLRRTEIDGTEIDAVFIVASDNEDDGDSYALRIIQEATIRGIDCIGLQLGKALENEQGKQVEHFGFRDGVSQPLIEGIDDEDIAKMNVNKEKFSYEDFVLFGLAGDFEWANNGSFLVYRRLQQDVAGFWEFMNKHCSALCSTPEELAARFVGRWKSGAPIAKHRSDPVAPKDSDFNDFAFSNDPMGANTPKFAHVRMLNPRDIQPNQTTHMILRRAIPYGLPWAKNQDPGADRGLLFMCFQRDLYEQFEFLQKRIYNKTNYPTPDPDNPAPHDELVNLVVNLGFRLYLEHWVICTGGEYFFSPPISALENLLFPRFLQDSMRYEEWTKKWWLWLLGISSSINPALDKTGKYSATNQAADSEAWFLVGTLGDSVERKCIIPKGKAILLPIINSVHFLAEEGIFKSESELEAKVKSEIDSVIQLSVTIDGVQLPGLGKYRVNTRPFTVTLPKDNLWYLKAGPTTAAADGYWLFLKPLSVGEHTIRFVGRDPDFRTEVIYKLTIVETNSA
jgi:Dyp-type peroxidase family